MRWEIEEGKMEVRKGREGRGKVFLYLEMRDIYTTLHDSLSRYFLLLRRRAFATFLSIPGTLEFAIPAIKPQASTRHTAAGQNTKNEKRKVRPIKNNKKYSTDLLWQFATNETKKRATIKQNGRTQNSRSLKTPILPTAVCYSQK